MLWTPTKGNTLIEQASASATTGASSSTKGTAAQIIASTARETHLLVISAYSYALAATASEMAFDILVGASTESVLIANLLGGHAGLKTWFFPVYIPAGTRIAAQAAGARLSTACSIQVQCVNFPGGPPFKVGSKVTTYGIGTVPNGTSITPGASGAEGSYTQITASTSEAHFAIIPSFQVAADTTTNLRYLSIDVGVGAATEETALENWLAFTTANEEMGSIAWPAWKDIPASTRLAMRVSNSGTNDGAYNGVLHCVS